MTLTMAAQLSTVRRAPASSLLLAALFLQLSSSVSALSVSRSINNVNGRCSAHHHALHTACHQPSSSTQSPQPTTFATTNRYRPLSPLFSKASDGQQQFQSSSSNNVRYPSFLTLTLLSNISHRIVNLRRSIHSTLRATAILSLLLLGLLGKPSARDAARFASFAAVVGSTNRSNKFLLSISRLPLFVKFGAAALVTDRIIVQRYKAKEDDGMMNGEGVGIPGGAENRKDKKMAVPLSMSWIKRQLKLIDDKHKKIPLKERRVSRMKDERHKSWPKWIEWHMSNAEKEEIVSMKKRKENHRTRLSGGGGEEGNNIVDRAQTSMITLEKPPL